MIDNGADQAVINERVAGLMEGQNKDVTKLATLVTTITTDFERRLRYLERTVAWGLGGIGVISAVLMLASKVWK